MVLNKTYEVVFLALYEIPFLELLLFEGTR